MEIAKKSNNKKIKIELNHTQIAYAISSGLIVLFFVFISGYYLGKHIIADQLSEQLNRDVLSDQIQKAFYVDLQEIEDIEQNQDQQDMQKTVEENLGINVNNIENNIVEIESKESTEEYAAHLAGFGTYKSAQNCVENYKKHGVNVSISKRNGKTAKGKMRVWYQVVTPWYENKETLENVLPNIKKIGNLKDVTLVVRDKIKV